MQTPDNNTQTTAPATQAAETTTATTKAPKRPAAAKKSTTPIEPGQPGNPRRKKPAAAKEAPAPLAFALDNAPAATADGFQPKELLTSYGQELTEKLREELKAAPMRVSYPGDVATDAAAQSHYLELWSKALDPAHRALEYNNPQDMQHLVRECAAFIEEHKLYTTFTRQGSSCKFVNVEGWAYAAHRLGWLAQVATVKQKPAGILVKVRVVVLATGLEVGKGWGYCAYDEKGKEEFTGFAILSMAQTRAVSKAYRNLLAWVVRAAGYESTPAEEMEFLAPTTPAPVAGVADVQQAQEPAPAMADMVLTCGLEGGKIVTKPASQPTGIMARVADAKANPAGTPRQAPSTHPVLAEEPQAAPKVAALADAAEPSQDINDYLTGTEGKPIAKDKGLTVNENLWATVAQKEELIRLCGIHWITRSERIKMLLNLNRMHKAYAATAITKMQKSIDDREAGREEMPKEAPAQAVLGETGEGW